MPEVFFVSSVGEFQLVSGVRLLSQAGFDGTGVTVDEEELPPDLISVLPEWVGPLAIAAWESSSVRSHRD